MYIFSFLIFSYQVSTRSSITYYFISFYFILFSKILKSEAAAARLKRIFPGVRSEGIVLTIPMPGHPFTSQKNIPAEKDHPFPPSAESYVIQPHTLPALEGDAANECFILSTEKRKPPGLSIEVFDKDKYISYFIGEWRISPEMWEKELPDRKVGEEIEK